MSQSAVNNPFTADESSGGAREFQAVVNRMIGQIYTVTVVRVVSVDAGATGAVGFLNATDMIQQMDGNNQGMENVPMINMPYFRLQGGANAVIIDPEVGDLGIALFARRDITELKRNKREAPPPSLRSNDVSDGLYIGGLLNAAPSQWIHFLGSGIHIKSTAEITMDCTKLKVNAPIESTKDITDNVDDQTSSMAKMREAYNSHTHLGNGAGNQTDTPNKEM